MPPTEKPYKLFFSAAEPSADAHCAALITSLEKSGYEIECVGTGGPRMASAGCRLIAETTSRAAMTYKAFGQVGRYWGLLRRIIRLFETETFDLVVVCDSPSFNFHVAKAAKRAGFQTLFYVAPQLWAWAGWRVGKLRRTCDKLACILPFEQDWFRSRGLDAVFVGHPLLDGLPTGLAERRKTYDGFEPSGMRLALMPGSRPAEITSLWPAMQNIAMRLCRHYPRTDFCAVASDAGQIERLRNLEIDGFECRYSIDSVVDSAREADFSIVASGSATLQVAAAGCPMVILYQSSRFLWHLVGRWLVKTRHLSLVNILAGKELVPEFMPYFRSIEPIVESVRSLVDDPQRLALMSKRLISLAQPLHTADAAEKLAAVVLEMLHRG
jgi:lipid-A-disaccharide synthase